MKSCGRRLSGLSLCALLLACSPNQHPELRRVSGTVTLHGEPVADATVAFCNDASARFATGRTDQHGRFTLTSYNPGDGALPGEHQVVVTKIEASDDENLNLSMDEALQARPRKHRPQQLLPPEYASRDTTPLVVSVSEEGEEDLLIELSGTPSGR